jgi:hypothetical protein
MAKVANGQAQVFHFFNECSALLYAIVVQFKRNPYYQAFCGLTEFSLALPCDSTDLVYFSNFSTGNERSIITFSVFLISYILNYFIVFQLDRLFFRAD